MFFDESRLPALVSGARNAAARAHAPYSQFRVGACLLADDGSLFFGCNVENASYGLAICAERNAIFQMVAAGRRSFEAIIVYTPTPDPTPPCGACRQVMNEFSRDAVVISVCDGTGLRRATVAELLPGAFDLKTR
ncbi:MAG: cytidine deaminase [Polyangiaceae bacterium]|nr:cytidine deaminase [Polyangiaceae bacterium]